MGCLGFLLWSAAEVAILWTLSGWLGAPTLVLALLAKAVIAWQLAMLWGRRAARKSAEALAEGRPVEAGQLRGAAVLFGTLMLVPPAPLVNLAGLLLLLPTRHLLVPLVRARMEAALRRGRFVVVDFGGAAPVRRAPGDGDVIDVEAETIHRDEPALPPKKED
jgi:UPF0716 protein FxsA